MQVLLSVIYGINEGGVHCFCCRRCFSGRGNLWDGINSETSFDLPVCFGTLHATSDSTCAISTTSIEQQRWCSLLVLTSIEQPPLGLDHAIYSSWFNYFPRFFFLIF
ncbi:hypothetical protein BS78_03G012000 [Paspalum vaginatum]|nr:hypothetical protein BS78_03G012000 [Paspalum vaginatum]